jgi:hypothetical protein
VSGELVTVTPISGRSAQAESSTHRTVAKKFRRIEKSLFRGARPGRPRCAVFSRGFVRTLTL